MPSEPRDEAIYLHEVTGSGIQMDIDRTKTVFGARLASVIKGRVEISFEGFQA